MLKAIPVKIMDIYVPTDRRKELDQKKVDTIVEAMMEGEPEKPVRVREGKGRYVLVGDVNQLEASKTLGGDTIAAYLVQARKF